MNLHNRIIKLLIDNPFFLEPSIEMFDTKLVKEYSLSKYGDIDILATGFDYLTTKKVQAVIEIKSHKGLVAHYISHQLPKYKESFPNAKQFIGYLNGKELNLPSIIFEEHTKIT